MVTSAAGERVDELMADTDRSSLLARLMTVPLISDGADDDGGGGGGGDGGGDGGGSGGTDDDWKALVVGACPAVLVDASGDRAVK